MENAWLVIVSSLISGLLGALLTLLFKKLNDSKKEKQEIFKTLLSFRYDITNQTNVNAMNRIQSVFYGNQSVIDAWTEFNETANASKDANAINDKYLKLLEQIASAAGYKNIRWDDIKVYYFPVGLSQRIAEENALRTATLKNLTGSQNNQNVPQKDQMAFALVLEALKQPNGMEQIVKLMETSNKINNGGK